MREMQAPERWIRDLKRRRNRQLRRFRRLALEARRLLVKVSMWAFVAALVVYVVSWSCGAPPRTPENLCGIFKEKRSWYRAMKRSAKQWGVPEAVQMSILYQESSFRARVRPPRKWFLWIIPGPRPSTAYGYGQVLDATWASYQQKRGRPDAVRHHFADVADFVGWYGDHIHRVTGIAKDDAYGLYLAYHDGPAGYRRGTHLKKAWLLKTARRVESRGHRYQNQYDGCRRRLEKWWIFW